MSITSTRFTQNYDLIFCCSVTSSGNSGSGFKQLSILLSILFMIFGGAALYRPAAARTRGAFLSIARNKCLHSGGVAYALLMFKVQSDQGRRGGQPPRQPPQRRQQPRRLQPREPQPREPQPGGLLFSLIVPRISLVAKRVRDSCVCPASARRANTLTCVQLFTAVTTRSVYATYSHFFNLIFLVTTLHRSYALGW